MVKAVRTFIAHKDGQHKQFQRGDEIPEDWIEAVGTRTLIDEDVDHLPTLAEIQAAEAKAAGGDTGPEWSDSLVESYNRKAEGQSVDVLVEWVLDDRGPDDKRTRAEYARVREGEGRRRSTAISQLGEIIRSTPSAIEVSSDPEADDPASS